MEDYDNWENGEYKGDKKRIEKMTDDLLGIIKEHKKIYKGPEENCPSCGRPKESPKLTCYHIFHKV